MHQYENDGTVDEVLLWEMIKLQIRDTSIKYSKPKIKKMKNNYEIKTKDGVNITNDSDILRECNSFYNELYTSKITQRTENLQELSFDQEHPKLNQIDKEQESPLGILTGHSDPPHP